MGKKKDKHGKHGHEATAHDGSGSEGHAQDRAGAQGAFVPLAGLAAMVTQQLQSPMTRTLMASGLRAAADALSRNATPPSPPVPPVPPVPPEAPVARDPAEPPRDDRQALPPEIARVIDSVASGIERWAVRLGQPKP